MIKVALLPVVSTSDEAARSLCGEDAERVYYPMISDVFLATAEGRTDYSVIPIENTIEGSVNLHMDWLLHEVDLPIQAEWIYPSRQQLIGRKDELLGAGGEPEYGRIVKVFSHPVALAQCQSFLRGHLQHAQWEPVSSTAEAVRIVSENPGQGWAAIGLTLAAAHYGLDVLRERVTDHDNNYTRFLLAGPKPFELRQSPVRKTSILVTLPEDYPGALHQVLSAFAWRRINLGRIESRPTKKRLGTYHFVIDIEMALDTVLLPAALQEIEAIGCQVRVLGTYPSFGSTAD
ncbi:MULTISPECIES: prephenate dehydratase [unclassified Paenibacillus]|uniref:prephenate dehydratase n=1 Tax=unclassified Paenibacillus TaxID=185978 RepID=UPI00095618AD|nr:MULTISPECIES: prephenate dehydratase [unclassified Paenibacillus]ASS66315.1 prephenate dehydratase [Paenibacillus sp. RUD330]SIQ08141.1 prephenate dehydratase [Paenibacillus sp. RU4X]SIQ28222.1 prephenate dehydratase [Paenibacillus sp. RU4T]